MVVQSCHLSASIHCLYRFLHCNMKLVIDICGIFYLSFCPALVFPGYVVPRVLLFCLEEY